MRNRDRSQENSRSREKRNRHNEPLHQKHSNFRHNQSKQQRPNPRIQQKDKEWQKHTSNPKHHPDHHSHTHHPHQQKISTSKPSQPQQKKSQVCPFLVRTYYSLNNPNIIKKEEDLPIDRMSTTLTDVVEVLRAHVPSLRAKQKFVLARVYQEAGKFVRTEMGTVVVNKKDMPTAFEENWKLREKNFNIGDFIDICASFS